MHLKGSARVDRVLAMRLANADILPYDVVRYATDTRDQSRHSSGWRTHSVWP